MNRKYEILPVIAMIMTFHWSTAVASQQWYGGSSSNCTLSSQDYNSLYDLYNATNGELWKWKTPYTTYGYPWTFTSTTTNPCSYERPWQGVVCENVTSSCSVIDLILPNMNLIGTLPVSIGNFTYLETLNLQSNPYLSGTLPSTLQYLQQSLTILQLSNNSFTGSLPSWLQMLTKLQLVDLSYNEFYGSIPNEWQNLTQLQYLVLESNQLTGTIPASLGERLTGLQVFAVNSNQLIGTIPDRFGRISTLTIFDVSDNRLTGVIPRTFCTGNTTSSSSSLQYFSVSQNELIGTIPSCYFNSSTLLSLTVNSNRLTGTLPDGHHQHSVALPLMDLDLSDNNIFGTIPDSFKDFTSLVNVYFSDCQLTGTIPLSFTQLVNITDFVLDNNHFYGEWNQHYFQNSTKLSYLDLGYNRFHGNILNSLQHLTSTTLAYLYVDKNSFTGTIPEDVCVHKSPTSNSSSLLTDLYLSENLFFGPVRTAFLTNCSVLHYAELNANFFTGTLPDLVTEDSHLIELQLDNNVLSGTIPSSWLMLQSWLLSFNMLTGSLPLPSASSTTATVVKEIQVGINHLSGTLSPAIDRFHSSLLKLNVGHNRFVGTIPSSFGNLTSLKVLLLDNNQLTGTIPSTLGNMTDIEVLDVAYNLLTGTITGEMFNAMPYLGELVLAFNLLTGTIPPSMGNTLYSMTEFILAGNILTGSAPCTIGQMQQILTLNLQLNALSGTLCNSLGNLIHANAFFLSSNFFSGQSPTTLNQITYLLSFDASINLLTGKIDAMLVPPLVLFAVSQNYLTGTLPSSIQQLQQLQVFFLYDNMFSGTYPNIVTDNMVVMYLDNNRFSGTLPSNIIRKPMKAISFNNNQFSGTIPDNFFSNATNLISIVLSINCFTGSIPTSICNANKLIQLSLDGLHSAPSCSQRIIPFYEKSGLQSTHGVGGTIPSCLWSLPNLEAFTLSGNNLKGSIGDRVLPASNQSLPTNVSTFNAYELTTVIASNNQLRGDIPGWMSGNESTIDYLDLSFNRIGGDIPSIEVSAKQLPTRTLYLQDNRLSGQVPSSLLDFNHINVLEGNLISCNADRSDIPSNDPSADSYVCGSDSTNIALVVCCVIVFLCLIWIVWKIEWSVIRSYVVFVLTPCIIIQNKDDFNVFDLVYWYCQVCFFSSIFIFIPLYLTVGYGFINSHTYLHRYVWQFSGLYLEGWEPWVIFLFIVMFVKAISLVFETPTGQWTFFRERETDEDRKKRKYPMGRSFASSKRGSRRQSSRYQNSRPQSRRQSRRERRTNGDGMTEYEDEGNSNYDEQDTDKEGVESSNDEGSKKSRRDDSSAVATSAAASGGSGGGGGASSASSRSSEEEYYRNWAIFLFALFINVAIVLTLNTSYVAAVVSNKYSVGAVTIFTLMLSLFKLLWNVLLVNISTSTGTIAIDISPWAVTAISMFNNIVVPFLAETLASPNCFKYVVNAPPDITVDVTRVECFIFVAFIQLIILLLMCFVNVIYVI